MNNRCRILAGVFLATAFSLGLPSAQAQTVSRGPFLQMGTPSSVVIRWRTSAATDSRVRFGSSTSTLTGVVDVTGSTTEHTVKLTGLTPDTPYYYSVGSTTQVLSGGDSSTFFRTPPTVGTRKPYRIWVLGDAGTKNSSQRSVRDAYSSFNGSRYTDLWLMLGDNAYSDGTDSDYQSAVFDMYPKWLRQSVLWPTLGNHDGHSASSSSLSGPYYSIFTLPRAAESGGVRSGTEAYYSFDFGNIHFVCLNSTDVSRSTSGAMLTWLRQDLQNNTRDWTIAFWHHPPYSKGSHNSDSDGAMIDMRRNALPILESEGVDLVLTGHSHSYERSYLLDGHYGSSSSLTSSMKLDSGNGRTDGNGAYAKPTLGPGTHEGAVYVVAGSSGQTSGGSLDHPAMYVSMNTLGSLVIDVNGSQLTAQFLNSSGSVRDHFTIVKSGVAGPQAEFSATPTSGLAPLQVHFTNQSTGATSWAWDFDGNGTTDSTQQSPTYTYSAPGTYTVRLTATAASASDVMTKTGYIVATSSQATCGNGIREGAEVCDGAQLNGQTCQSQGFSGGTLTCRSTCAGFDTSGCTTQATCGNGIREGTEVCDGAQLNGQTCQSQGFSGGTLTCRSTCGGFNTSGCTTTSGASAVDVRIGASADDAEEIAAGDVFLTSPDLEMVYENSSQTVGLRFADVRIPRGARIVNAHVQFTADESQSEVTQLRIQGTAADNAATFDKTARAISSRPRTTASVSWAPAAWSAGEAATVQRTPTLAAVIQEIVNRSNWNSGNALALVVTGTGHRTAVSYDESAAGAPLLHVEYDAAPALPSNLVATALSPTRVELAWQNNGTNETGIRVERCTGSGCTSFAQVATAQAGATRFADASGIAGDTYGYRVLAFNQSGSSMYSNVSSVTMPNSPLSTGGDEDQDSVEALFDNCPTVANGSQQDGDSDGIGDACEDPRVNADVVVGESSRIDGSDYFRLARAFGTGLGDARFDIVVDLNRDYRIDGGDLALMAAVWAELVPR